MRKIFVMERNYCRQPVQMFQAEQKIHVRWGGTIVEAQQFLRSHCNSVQAKISMPHLG